MASTQLNPDFKYSAAVKAALLNGKPVVALESTIITHGMSYPENLETAMQVEAMIRSENVEPATIAILDGEVHIGLESFELKHLALLSKHRVIKTSRRDIAYVLASLGNGATTVSGTLCLAHKAGIHIFVTGGIGGVHRDVESTMDISADLIELSKTPMAVVCAGVKSILDIPRTLEFLETHGVTVITLGPTTDFPAFFTPVSGSYSPYHTPYINVCANLIHQNLSFNLQSGILIACPIPISEAIEVLSMESWIQQALLESKESKLLGPAVTPFLLKRISELSEGQTLKANISLIKNNAKQGASIAMALHELMKL